MIHHCPGCKMPGRKVKPVTLENLLRPEHLSQISYGQYFVCVTPDCPTIYFDDRAVDGGGTRFDRAALRVRFGLKETATPRPVCYCFNHTIEDIRHEIVRTGQSTVLASIKADIKQQGCQCEQTNPLGACCLETVSEVVKEGFRIAGISATAADTTDDSCVDDCCAPPSANRSGALAVGGSVIAAAISSACCWLPLIMLALGASAAGVSGFFGRWRVPLVGVAVVLLGIGFYFQYGRKPRCNDGACTVGSKRLRALNSSRLWVAAALIVAMIFFPSYVRHLVGGGGGDAAVARPTSSSITLVVPVEGMTCEGCSLILANALGRVSGVVSVDVSYADKRALVVVSVVDDDIRAAIVTAVAASGYNTNPAAITESP